MFTGFTHSIAGGNGKLIIPALQSPNFIHGHQGWTINADGSAEFQDVILPSGSGGSVVSFSATPPSNPNVGDIWFQI